MIEITEPGVYDIPADEYHADPIPGGSLSSSGAQKLLPPSCPALYNYERINGRDWSTTAFDFGHAAHKRVLGSGPEIVVVDADNWRTKAAQEKAEKARDQGAVPLLAEQYEQIEAMAAALREHPIASKLLDPDSGDPEQTLVWRDERTGIWRRARLDWLPHRGPGRMIIPDYKTTRSADPEKLQKAIHEYGYYMQADWYSDGVLTLDLADDTAFVFICQEKTPPYLVTVAEPDAAAMRIGRLFNNRAIDIYRECVATGHWPGYSDGVELISLPPWFENRWIEETTL